MNELKCCPFCGAEAELVKDIVLDDRRKIHYWIFYIRCTKCGIRSRDYSPDGYYGSTDTVRSAIDFWNALTRKENKNAQN